MPNTIQIRGADASSAVYELANPGQPPAAGRTPIRLASPLYSTFANQEHKLHVDQLLPLDPKFGLTLDPELRAHIGNPDDQRARSNHTQLALGPEDALQLVSQFQPLGARSGNLGVAHQLCALVQSGISDLAIATDGQDAESTNLKSLANAADVSVKTPGGELRVRATPQDIGPSGFPARIAIEITRPDGKTLKADIQVHHLPLGGDAAALSRQVDGLVGKSVALCCKGGQSRSGAVAVLLDLSLHAAQARHDGQRCNPEMLRGRAADMTVQGTDCRGDRFADALSTTPRLLEQHIKHLIAPPVAAKPTQVRLAADEMSAGGAKAALPTSPKPHKPLSDEPLYIGMPAAEETSPYALLERTSGRASAPTGADAGPVGGDRGTNGVRGPKGDVYAQVDVRGERVARSADAWRRATRIGREQPAREQPAPERPAPFVPPRGAAPGFNASGPDLRQSEGYRQLLDKQNPECQALTAMTREVLAALAASYKGGALSVFKDRTSYGAGRAAMVGYERATDARFKDLGAEVNQLLTPLATDLRSAPAMTKDVLRDLVQQELAAMTATERKTVAKHAANNSKFAAAEKRTEQKFAELAAKAQQDTSPEAEANAEAAVHQHGLALAMLQVIRDVAAPPSP